MSSLLMLLVELANTVLIVWCVYLFYTIDKYLKDEIAKLRQANDVFYRALVYIIKQLHKKEVFTQEDYDKFNKLF